MRLTMAAMVLAALTATAMSGCFTCDESQRVVEWTQIELPENGAVRFTSGSLVAYVKFFPSGASEQGNLTRVEAWITGYDHEVSHDDAVMILEALFAERGWPPPELAGASERFIRCSNSQ